jgi:hypothetical protein
MALSTSDPDHTANVKQFLGQLNLKTIDASTDSSLVLIGPDAELVSESTKEDLLEQDELSKEAVIRTSKPASSRTRIC